MSDLKKTFTAARFIMVAFILVILALSSLACSLSGTPTAVPVIPAQSPPPAADEAAPAPPVEVQPETAPEAVPDTNIVGFWRTKIVTKQVLILEFQENGQAIWHYRLNNGDKEDVVGAYSFEGASLMINIDNPQELTFQLEGDNLTLTGLDGKSLNLLRVANLDDLGPTASTNIPEDLVSRWQDTAVQEWLEFKSDGTLSITSNEDSIPGTYTLTDNNLEIKLENQQSSSTFRVEIDGNVLTLFAQDGSFVDYVK